MDYLYILREALVWTITIFWLYQIAISLCSLVKIKDKPLKVKKDHKFMAIIPAHNEEMVVGNLIESLKRQDYNKELYDIYVIADNCTDNTAKVAKEAGAIVYERFDEAKKTKGYALDWFLKQKIKEIDTIDFVKDNEDGTKQYVITTSSDIDLRKKLFEVLPKEEIVIFELKKTETTLEDAFIKLIDTVKVDENKNEKKKTKKSKEQNSKEEGKSESKKSKKEEKK